LWGKDHAMTASLSALFCKVTKKMYVPYISWVFNLLFILKKRIFVMSIWQKQTN